MSNRFAGASRSTRDKNEPEIVGALQDAGYVVIRINEPNIGDLLVYPKRRKGQKYRDAWLLEIKMPDGKLRPGQAEWAEAAGPAGIRYAVVSTADEALSAVRGK